MTPKITFEVEGYECSRCGHKWVPRTKTEIEPTICPKCKSPYWNKPRNASDRIAKDRLRGDKVRK